jgi:O-antigen ligase
MYAILQTMNSYNYNFVLLVIAFTIFLIPFSLGSVSANYFFVILPVLIVLLKGKLKIPDVNINVMLIFYFSIFFISFFFQDEFYNYLDRKLISFIIFMTLFSYTFINISLDMVNAFKISIVLVSLGITLVKITNYVVLGGDDLGFSAKALVGSQRESFVLVLAFFILLFYQPKTIISIILKVSFLLIILAGLINTFSRSSMIALILVLLVFFSSKINLKKIPNTKTLIKFSKYTLLTLITIFLTFYFLPVHFEFYLSRIYNFISGGEFFRQFLEISPDDTIGYRIVMLKDIFNFVLQYPLTGSGFLGCWIMYENLQCSAHNQYADVLFRTGFLGFMIYGFILFRIFNYLRSSNKDLFYGFLGVLLIGMVHETFKLSQGAFILSFFLAMTYDKKLNS